MINVAPPPQPGSSSDRNWSAPRPSSPATLRRTVKSLLASLLVIAVVIAAICTVAWTAATAMQGRRLGLLDGLTAASLLAVAILSLRLRRQTNAIRRMNGVPVCLQTCGRTLVELSCFGSGTLRGWTTTNEAVGLERIVIPGPSESNPTESEPEDDRGRAHSGAEIEPVRRRPISHSKGRLAANRQSKGETRSGARRRFSRMVADAALDRPEIVDLATGPTVPYRVQRGDTYWSLAERHLGDGRQWKALQDLNLARRVAPGVTLTETDTLRQGWQILVPVNPADGMRDL